MKTLFAISLCWIACAVFCFGRSDVVVHATIGNGSYLTAPYDVRKGMPVQWSVSLTNSASIPVRLDVLTRTDLIGDSGERLLRLSYGLTTNYLAPGAFKRLLISVEPGWTAPSGRMSYMTMEAAVLNRTTEEFSVNWHSASTFYRPNPFSDKDRNR